MSLPATTEETSFIASIKSELKVRALTLFIDNSFVIAEPLALFEENLSKAPTLMFKNSSREILPPPIRKWKHYQIEKLTELINQEFHHYLS